MEPVKSNQTTAQQDAAIANSKGVYNDNFKTGGNQRSNEDDLDLDKQPYHDEKPNQEDLNEEPDEQSFGKP